MGHGRPSRRRARSAWAAARPHLGAREYVDVPPSGECRIVAVADSHSRMHRAALDLIRRESPVTILHAGDVGSPEVLDRLSGVAPVIAVRGNMDNGGRVRRLPKTQVAEVGGTQLYVLHDLYQLDLDPAEAGFAAVVSGHTHRPAIVRRNGVLYVNPGSAGASRYDLPPSVALLEIEKGELSARVIELDGE